MRYILLFFLLLFVGCRSDQSEAIVKIDNNSSDRAAEDDKCSIEVKKGIDFSDPLFQYQWYLNNLALSPDTSVNNLVEGEDINLCTLLGGKSDIVVSVVDVGVEAKHADLADNIDLNRSFRFADRSSDPTPISKVSSAYAHGTACAGIIAAKSNAIGIRGVAPNITLLGLNAGDLSSDSDIAESLSWQGVDVSSNSWGSPDFFDESSSIEAIEEGIKYGREGKGVNYVFAPGNSSENTEFQSIMGSGYVIPVSALDGTGKLTSYSAIGANILVCAYGGAVNGVEEPAIVTTDFMGLNVGMDSTRTDRFKVEGNENGDYTRKMNGTSAAAPMVAGVVALMLSENPKLSYRDVRYILATTARKNDLDSSTWFQNGAGYNVSSAYGFGVIDAYAAVKRASDFSSLSAQQIVNATQIVDEEISNELEKGFEVSERMKVEFVQLELDMEHNDFQSLEIVIISPSNTQSFLVTPQSSTSTPYESPWIFSTVQFLDEDAKGSWRVKIVNKGSLTNEGILYSIKLIIKGHKDE